MQTPTAPKATFFFPHVPKRWSFQKNCAGIWSFLHYRERWYFFFPKTRSYTLDGKWKMIFLKYDIFFKPSEKMVFPKRAAPAHDLSCIIWKDGVFFPENIIFFPWAESKRRLFSRNTWKYDIFCVHVRVLQTWRDVPCQKKSRMVLSCKNTHKGDWRSRLTSSKGLQQFFVL